MRSSSRSKVGRNASLRRGARVRSEEAIGRRLRFLGINIVRFLLDEGGLRENQRTALRRADRTPGRRMTCPPSNCVAGPKKLRAADEGLLFRARAPRRGQIRRFAYIPDSHGSIATAGSEAVAIGAECHIPDQARVAAKGEEFAAG